jgi:DNA-3-methyladenine glycosylase II
MAREADSFPAMRIESLRSLDLPAVLASLSTADPMLGELITRVGDFRLEPRYSGSPYHNLFRAIVYQQLSGRAAGTILSRVLAIHGDGGPPEPAALLATPDEALRAAGLSRNKLLALRDLAAKTLDGTVPSVAGARRMSDDVLIERLVAVRGVGRWTAEMLLIFGLGRTDVLPAVDLGIRKGYALTFRRRALPDADAILRRGKRWRPWRTVASWYLWRAVDTVTPGAGPAVAATGAGGEPPRSRRDSR